METLAPNKQPLCIYRGTGMSWDEKATKAMMGVAIKEAQRIQATGERVDFHRPFLAAARWQREQLRTDEAVERAAQAVFSAEHHGEWDAAESWVREDCRMAARAAITALLGEEEER